MAAKRLYKGADPRDLPNYTAAEAARWLGVVQGTLRTWHLGHTYTTQQGPKCAKPVIKPAAKDPLELSFWNLVESSVLASIRKVHGVSLQKVRRALNFVERELNSKRPLIEQQFATDGVHLFVERFGQLVSASQSGQVVIRELLAASLTRIERDPKGLAAKLYPWTHDPKEPRVVAVDPAVSFGRPTLIATGVPVETIMERFRAGDSIESLAEDYRVKRDLIEGAVRWAAGGAAAA